MYPPQGLPESFGPHHPPQGGSEEELIPAMESLGRTGGLGDPFVTGVVTGGLGDPAFVTQAVVSGDQSSVSQHTGPPLSGSQVFHSVPGSQVSQVNTTSGSTVSVGGIPGPSGPTGSLPTMPSFLGAPVQQFFSEHAWQSESTCFASVAVSCTEQWAKASLGGELRELRTVDGKGHSGHASADRGAN